MPKKKGKGRLTDSPPKVLPDANIENKVDLALGGVSCGQDQFWSEEAVAVREARFKELRKSSIPQTLVEAVCSFRHNATVRFYYRVGAPRVLSSLKVVIEEGTAAEADVVEGTVCTAGEALAMFLEGLLWDCRAESAPVRSKNMLAPSATAAIATYLLEICAQDGHPPGPFLRSLITSLLEVKKRPLQSSRQFVARDEAVWVIAQRPDVGTRELARIVNVEPSTVSRWRNDEEFNELVERTVKTIKAAKIDGLWPSEDHSAKNKAIDAVIDSMGKVLNVLAGWRECLPSKLKRKLDQIIEEGEEIVEQLDHTDLRN